MKEYKTEKKGRRIVVLFIISVIIYYCLGAFNKSIFLMCDEMYYLEAARAFIHGNGIFYNGVYSNFQKILYSLLISPAFMVEDLVLQMRLQTLISSLLVASSVFPAYFLAKEAGLDERKQFIFCFFILTYPETSFCMIFMSETLYYPLWLWVILFVYRFIKREKTSFVEAIVMGVLSYALYMCKEVGGIAMPALLGIECLYAIRGKSNIKRMLLCLTSCMSFGVCFLVFRFLLFSRIQGAYTIRNICDMLHPKGVLFVLFALGFYFIYTILSVYVFPIFYIPSEDSCDRKFYYYASGVIVALIFTIVLTITTWEDYGLASPRLHLRYYAPVSVVFFLLFLRQNEPYIKENNKKDSIRRALLFIYLICLIIVPVLSIHGLMDSSNMELYRVVGIAAEKLFGEKKGCVIYYIVLKTCIIVLASVYMIVMKKKRELFFRLFPLCVIIFNVLNLCLKTVEIRSMYSITKEELEQVCEADNVLDNLMGKKLLICSSPTDHQTELAMTYHDNIDTDFAIYVDEISDEITLMAGTASRKAYINEYDYIMISNELYQKNLKKIESFNPELIWTSPIYSIYKIE